MLVLISPTSSQRDQNASPSTRDKISGLPLREREKLLSPATMSPVTSTTQVDGNLNYPG